ncbi:hypothetical protein L486_03136 [Kwoniella mangroviensis CBS 10435]|uniref:Nephrocystin 3-like N-terminal domain-containing protein n=1 Tax=Kwoniella mangroviensis CBS 10435 TaxID=1331196 RepID=A0A1B9ISZ8_9TREE|nr:hypothetical protein L486_03136 [Kwoniella mangroviensis CBS 10435]
MNVNVTSVLVFDQAQMNRFIFGSDLATQRLFHLRRLGAAFDPDPAVHAGRQVEGCEIWVIKVQGVVETSSTGSTIVLLSGFPGVGKKTVAQSLLRSFPEARLFDNHLLIDATAAVLDREDEAYQSLRQAFRSALFSTLSSYPSSIPPILLFTECQSTKSGAQVMNEYLEFASSTHSRLISIILECSMAENVKRLIAEDRMKAGNTKLTDIEVLKYMKDNYSIHRYGDRADKEWVIDTSGESVEDVVNDIRMKLISVTDTT